MKIVLVDLEEVAGEMMRDIRAADSDCNEVPSIDLEKIKRSFGAERVKAFKYKRQEEKVPFGPASFPFQEVRETPHCTAHEVQDESAVDSCIKQNIDPTKLNNGEVKKVVIVSSSDFSSEITNAQNAGVEIDQVVPFFIKKMENCSKICPEEFVKKANRYVPSTLMEFVEWSDFGKWFCDLNPLVGEDEKYQEKTIGSYIFQATKWVVSVQLISRNELGSQVFPGIPIKKEKRGTWNHEKSESGNEAFKKLRDCLMKINEKEWKY